MANKSIASPTAALIFAAWKKQGEAEKSRTYLGASIIGHECDMYLWLYFRMAFREGFDGRMFRLFDRGKREEAVFCDDLRRIGCEVREFDENGNQFEVSDLGGHFSGHLDGIVRGMPEAPKQWFVAEFKTHSDSSFKKLSKEGVRSAKPMHYAQMTVYMGKTGLKKAVYMAVNKDNDDLWVETIDFNKDEYDNIIGRARHIISTCTPSRCSSRPDDFRCKFCQAKAVCWHDANQFVDPSVPTSCRTCCHATAETDGDGARWTCRLGHECKSSGTVECADHLIIPAFVKAEIADGSPTSITYSCKGKDFTCGGGGGGFSTEELKRFGPSELDGVLTVKNTIPGSTVESSNSIESNYEAEEFWTCFTGPADKAREWCDGHPLHNWSTPASRSEHNGVMYFEYASGEDRTLLVVNNGAARIVTNIPPF